MKFYYWWIFISNFTLDFNKNWLQCSKPLVENTLINNNWNNVVVNKINDYQCYIHYDYNNLLSTFVKTNDDINDIHLNYCFPGEELIYNIKNNSTLSVKTSSKHFIGNFNNINKKINLLYNNYEGSEIYLKIPYYPKIYKDNQYKIYYKDNFVHFNGINFTIFEKNRFLTIINNTIINGYGNNKFFSYLSSSNTIFFNNIFNDNNEKNQYILLIFNKDQTNFSKLYLCKSLNKIDIKYLLKNKFQIDNCYKFYIKNNIDKQNLIDRCVVNKKVFNILINFYNNNLVLDICATFRNDFLISLDNNYDYSVEKSFCDNNKGYNGLLAFQFCLFFTLQFFFHFFKILLNTNDSINTKLYYVFHKLFHNGNFVILTLGLTIILFTSTPNLYPNGKSLINYQLYFIFLILHSILLSFNTLNCFQWIHNKKNKYLINSSLIQNTLMNFFKKNIENEDEIIKDCINILEENNNNTLLQLTNLDNIVSIVKIYMDYIKNTEINENAKKIFNNFIKFLENLLNINDYLLNNEDVINEEKISSINKNNSKFNVIKNSNHEKIIINSLVVLYYSFLIAIDTHHKNEGCISFFLSQNQRRALNEIILIRNIKGLDFLSIIKKQLQTILVNNETHYEDFWLIFNEISIYLINLVLWGFLIYSVIY